MKMRFFFISACLAATSVVQAEDLALPNDRVLKDVKVIETGMDYLRISHESGIATIKAPDLPTDWQEKYKMTQEDVSARKNLVKKREEDLWQKQKDSVSEAQKHPRYLTASDMQTILMVASPTVSPLEIEAATARWNGIEARRLGDKVMYDFYNQALTNLQPQLIAFTAQKQKQEAEEKKKWETENTGLKVQLAQYEAFLRGQERENQRLSDSLKESEKEKDDDKTVVWSAPWWWSGWGFNGTVIIPEPAPTWYPPARPVPPKPQPKVNVMIDKTRSSSGSSSPRVQPSSPSSYTPSRVQPAPAPSSPRVQPSPAPSTPRVQPSPAPASPRVQSGGGVSDRFVPRTAR